jgi:hypothetical protein
VSFEIGPEQLADPERAADAIRAVEALVGSDPDTVIKVGASVLQAHPFIARTYPVMAEVLARTGQHGPLAQVADTAKRAAQHLVSIGAVHRAADFLGEVAPAFPDPLEPCALLYRQVSEVTERYRAEARGSMGAPAPRRLVLAVSVWGPRYVHLLMRYVVPSLLAEGNLPTVTRSREAHVDIYTTAEGAEAIRSAPAFAALGRYARIHFTLFSERILASPEYARPESLLRYRMFGAFHHLAIERARVLRADISLMTPDVVWSDGKLGSFVGFVDGGYDCVLATCVRSQAETVLPLLDRAFDPSSQALSVPPRRMVEINLRNVHHGWKGFILTKGNRNMVGEPSVLAFPHARGLHLRCLHIHPWLMSAAAIAKDIAFDYTPVDSTALERFFPDEDARRRMKVVQDSDQGWGLDVTYVYDAETSAFLEHDFEFSLGLLERNAAAFLPLHYRTFRHRIDVHCDAELDAIGTFDRRADGSLDPMALPVASRIDLDDETVAAWVEAIRPRSPVAP